MSSHAPTTVMNVAPMRIPRVRSLSGMNSSPAITAPAKIASPPSSGVARSPGRALSAVDGADPARETGDDRRQQRSRGEGHEEAVEGVALHVAGEDRRVGGWQGASVGGEWGLPGALAGTSNT